MGTSARLTRPLDAVPGAERLPRDTAPDGAAVTPWAVLLERNGERSVSYPPTLPLADGELDALHVLSVVEHVRDDEVMMAELARVLGPVGRLTLRLPAINPTGFFDALSLGRYIADIVPHARRPLETDEIGWRRRYPPDDAVGLVTAAGFRVVSAERRGTGLPELLNLLRVVRYRTFTDNPTAYAKAERQVERWYQRDAKIKWRRGFWLVITAIRAD